MNLQLEIPTKRAPSMTMSLIDSGARGAFI
jgi:hypothetical protein